MIRALLLGVAPPTEDALGATGGPAFVGTDSGRRLAQLFGVDSDDDLDDWFWMRNCFDHPIQEVDWDGARAGAWVAVEEVEPELVLCCGVTPRNALGLHREWMRWRTYPHFEAAAIPHPSGRTRYWNDRANTESARIFLRALIERIEDD